MHIFPVFVRAWPFSAFDSLRSFTQEIYWPKILVFIIIIIIIIIILDGSAVQSAFLMDRSLSAVFF
jgi:branched-subunit amino acid transport protein AzlD